MEQKVAVITGVSHSRGIGAATCRKLAESGIDIFFTHYKAATDWEQSFEEELEKAGVKARGIDLDLSAREAYMQVLDEAEKQVGYPSILINNAAYSERDGFMNLDAEKIDAHYQVNMRSAMLLCAEFSSRFQKNLLTEGRIINLTSGQAEGPMVDELAYVATKGAISAFTVSLAAEVAPYGITVNAVNPGPNDTGWMTEEIKKVLLPKFPMKRIGQPTDTANLIGFLASRDGGWITGQILNSEGGFLRS